MAAVDVCVVDRVEAFFGAGLSFFLTHLRSLRTFPVFFGVGFLFVDFFFLF